MPQTRTARLKAIKDASDLRDMLQLHDTATNLGWNDYLNWDLPQLTYQTDGSAWYQANKAKTGHSPLFANPISHSTKAASALLDASDEAASNTEFCGLQPWYSNPTRDLSSTSPIATTPPLLSKSGVISYDSTPLSDISQQVDQAYGSQQWSPEISRRPDSLDAGMYAHRTSDAESSILVREPEERPSLSSEEEIKRIGTGKSDAHKKRKTAHSVIEKKYRCRINDGMAELRHCVPSREKGNRSLDSGAQSAPDHTASNQSSGKVAILSDAVQYVKTLERQNKALYGQLDVMNRRNVTLRKIAMSKANTTLSAEEMDDDDGKSKC